MAGEVSGSAVTRLDPLARPEAAYSSRPPVSFVSGAEVLQKERISQSVDRRWCAVRED